MTAFTGKIEEQMSTVRGSKMDEEAEEIMLVESWPHIQIVYELLLRLIILKQYDVRLMV